MSVRLGDLAGEATTRDNLSHVLAVRGRLAEAITHARRSVELHRRAGRTDALASALNSVGWLTSGMQDAAGEAAARQSRQEAVAVLEAVGHADAEIARGRLTGRPCGRGRPAGSKGCRFAGGPTLGSNLSEASRAPDVGKADLPAYRIFSTNPSKCPSSG